MIGPSQECEPVHWGKTEKLWASQGQPKRISLGGQLSPGVKMTSKCQRHASAQSFLKVYWLLFSKSMHLKNHLEILRCISLWNKRQCIWKNHLESLRGISLWNLTQALQNGVHRHLKAMDVVIRVKMPSGKYEQRQAFVVSESFSSTVCCKNS